MHFGFSLLCGLGGFGGLLVLVWLVLGGGVGLWFWVWCFVWGFFVDACLSGTASLLERFPCA